ncbi:putative porin [Mariniflexile ostreae]|uniref:Porin n=1 Tax=Mariniflexile ostreae TaxID=1520892 RepID=A0ABV5FB36_9FLAO
MKRLVLGFFLVSFFSQLSAQTEPLETNREVDTVSSQEQKIPGAKTSQRKPESIKNTQDKKARIQDYLIISVEKDTTYVDTTLTIYKEYKYNYLRRDNFGLMPFGNLGQTYNALTYNFQNTSLMPEIGASARHYNYMEVEDIYYYRVPTPLTELFFKTAFEQGQLLDALFTVNTSPQLNMSIAYKGLRSLGKYQRQLTSTGNFRFSANYQTKNKKYFLRTHAVAQDLMNQENGGIKDSSVENFENGNPEFLDRSIVEVNFDGGDNAENILKGKRFYLDHTYDIINKRDSLSENKLSIGHVLTFKDKSYAYSQNSANVIFGEAFKTTSLRDLVTLEDFYNQFHVNFSNNILGDLQFNISNNNYNYGYDNIVNISGTTITNRLKGNVFSAGGKYHKQYRGFDLKGELGLNIAGDFDGNFLKATASFKLNDDISASATLNHSSKAPNYNVLLYHSDYKNYNWNNNFNNIKTQQLAFQLKSKKYATVSIDYSTISDHTYFKKEDNLIKAFQNNSTINYFRIKLENEIKFKNLALNSTILYQETDDKDNTLNVPQLTTRNTLYYGNHMFKKALYLQTGVTLNYFTKYYMSGYDAVLAEFYVQRDMEYGGFPRLDFFINAKVRQTRIYVKAEHFNAAFTGYDYYSAPGYPYRDFAVRFGVVWNFFM